MRPVIAVGDEQACPYCLAVEQRLREDATSGTVLTRRMLELDQTRSLYQLCKRQDQLFDI